MNSFLDKFRTKDKTSKDSPDKMANILQKLFEKHHEDLRIMRSTVLAQTAVIGLLKIPKANQNKDVTEVHNKVGFNTLDDLMSIQKQQVGCAENSFTDIKLWLWFFIEQHKKLPRAWQLLEELTKSSYHQDRTDSDKKTKNSESNRLKSKISDKAKGSKRENLTKNETRFLQEETSESTKNTAEDDTDNNSNDNLEIIDSDYEAIEKKLLDLKQQQMLRFDDWKKTDEKKNSDTDVKNEGKADQNDKPEHINPSIDGDISDTERAHPPTNNSCTKTETNGGIISDETQGSNANQSLTNVEKDDIQAMNFCQKEIGIVLETIREMVGLIKVKTESQNQDVDEYYKMSNFEVSEKLSTILDELLNLWKNKLCAKLMSAEIRERERKQRTVDLQLYFIRNDDVMMNVVSYMSTIIRDKLKECEIDATIEYCNTPEQIKPNVPVLVLFINCSRLVTDGIAAIKGINLEVTGRRHIALVAFHHIDVGFAIEKGAIVGSQFNGIAGVHHMAFTTEKGVYERNENEDAINAIVSFVINLSK